MPRTKQRPDQQPIWSEVFANDSDEDDDDDIDAPSSTIAAAKRPLPKKPRLSENKDDTENFSSATAPSSTTRASVVARINSTFPSFLSSSGSSSGGDDCDSNGGDEDTNRENLPVRSPPRTAQKRPAPPQSTPQPPQRSGTSPRKWRLLPTTTSSHHKITIKSPSTNAPDTQAAASTTTPSTPAVEVQTQQQQPHGWKTREEMHQIAKQHQGTYLQYKVLHRPPGGPEQVRDRNFSNRSNDIITHMIFPHDLVVQSRFVSKSGNYGGNSYSFVDWKLPGNFLKKRRHHMTIFKDTRPKLFHPPQTQAPSPAPTPPTQAPLVTESQPLQEHDDADDNDDADVVPLQQEPQERQEPLHPLPTQPTTSPTPPTATPLQQTTYGDDKTAYPLLFLSPELSAEEVNMITKFVQEAPSGCTPREFFRDHQDQLRLATPARELRLRQDEDDEQSIDVEERGGEQTSSPQRAAAKRNGDNTEPDDPMMMDSDDEDNENLPPDTTIVENGRFLQYVFHDLNPPRELDSAVVAAAAAASQPVLTEELLVAHERRWSTSSTPPANPIHRMLNWSNESNFNSDSAPPSRIEHRLQPYSLIEQPSGRKLPPTVAADITRAESIPSPPTVTRGTLSDPRAMLPNQPTLDDFSILRSEGSTRRVARKQQLSSSSEIIVKGDRIILPGAKKNHPKASPVQRNLERVFAETARQSAAAEGVVDTPRMKNLRKHALVAHDGDQREVMADEGDDLLPFVDDWNEDAQPTIMAGTNPSSVHDSHVNQSQVQTSSVKSRKAGRSALWSKLWLGLLILVWLPMASKYDPLYDSLKGGVHRLATFSKTWYGAVNLACFDIRKQSRPKRVSSMRLESLFRSETWNDAMRSLRFEDLFTNNTWVESISSLQFGELVNGKTWNRSVSSALRLRGLVSEKVFDELLGGGSRNDNLIEFPTTPSDACNAGPVESKPIGSSSLPQVGAPPVSAKPSTSSASSAQPKAWLRGRIKFGGFVTLGVAWFSLNFWH